MAGLLCLCGAVMSNSTAPSESIAEIHSPEALERGKDIELWDFSDEQWEYWHCQACQRVTVIDGKTGKYSKSYSRRMEQQPPCLDTLGEWQTLYYWSDREFYDGIEEEEKRTLGDFVQKHPPRYVIRLSPDESKAHVFRTDTKEYQCTYVRDPPPDFLKEP